MRWMLALGTLVPCAGDEDPVTTLPPAATACEGAGEPAVWVGSGGASGFSEFAAGTVVQVVDSGTYGFSFDLLSEGLDTTAPISTLVRYSVGDATETQDLIANLNLQCGDEGTGWTQVFATVPDAFQDASTIGDLDGMSIDLSTNLTDQAGETGTHSVTLELAAP